MRNVTLLSDDPSTYRVGRKNWVEWQAKVVAELNDSFGRPEYRIVATQSRFVDAETVEKWPECRWHLSVERHGWNELGESFFVKSVHQGDNESTLKYALMMAAGFIQPKNGSWVNFEVLRNIPFRKNDGE